MSSELHPLDLLAVHVQQRLWRQLTAYRATVAALRQGLETLDAELARLHALDPEHDDEVQPCAILLTAPRAM